MARKSNATFYLLAFAVASFALRSQASEFVLSESRVESPVRQLKLSCDSGKVSVTFEWALHVGAPGAYLRHLFLPGMGDRHVFLKIRPGGTSTGTANDAEAKDLLQLMHTNLNGESFAAEVFPDGRDEATGEWESAWFERTQFSAIVSKVAIECKWDMAKLTKSAVKTAAPGEAPDEQ